MPDQTPLAPYAPRTAYESLQIAVGPGIKEIAYSAARRHSLARDRDVPTIRPDEMAAVIEREYRLRE